MSCVWEKGNPYRVVFFLSVFFNPRCGEPHRGLFSGKLLTEFAHEVDTCKLTLACVSRHLPRWRASPDACHLLAPMLAASPDACSRTCWRASPDACPQTYLWSFPLLASPPTCAKRMRNVRNATFSISCHLLINQKNRHETQSEFCGHSAGIDDYPDISFRLQRHHP
jgi:hypothetical protein